MPIEPFDFTYNLTSESAENEVMNTLGKGRIKEFEPKSYFFTESTVVAQSTAEGAYGPDYVSTNTKFNITTQFELENKKAYAVTSGQVLIVPQSGEGNESKVNVFIKPLKHVDVGVPIKYYVYRGLKKEFFINSSNNVLPKNNTNTPFMAKVWTDLINFNELTEPLPEIPASLFGFSTTETDTNSLDVKFFNTSDATSTDENKVYNLPIIEAGHFFGEFKDNKGGFEIVLNDGFYYQEKSDTGFQFDINYAKAEKVVLNIADIAGNPNISEKIYRENVQKFMDPAAFYGAHITEKEKGEIKVVDNDAKYSTKAAIYNNIVNKFSNKHKCYIYLQCNRGRSFNFDEALGTDPLKIGISDTLVVSQYKTSDWPIIINEFEQTHNEDENEKRKSSNDLSLQLKFKTDNKNVTLYNTYGNCANAKIEGSFLTKESLVDEGNSNENYTNQINYRLINNFALTDGSLTTKSIATFIYITQEEKEVEYFNDFFGPITIDHLVKVNDQSSKKKARKSSSEKLKINKSLIDGKASANKFTFTTIPYINPNQATDDLFRLYILKKIDSENPEDRTLKQTTSNDIKFNTIETIDDYGSFEYGDKNYRVWKGQVNDDDDNNTPFNTLQLINFEGEGNVTNYMHLGLMNDDYNKVIYDSITDTSTNHIPDSNTNIYFHLDNTNIEQKEGSLFKKYRLGVKVETFDLFWGFNYGIIYPSLENEVFVYTIDGYYFFTKKFSEKFNFVEELAHANIVFRPKQNYLGEFGFDWMRLNETNEADYEKSIIGGYGFKDKKEAFQALKREYISIAQQNSFYYVPYLNIYPYSTSGTPHEINLDATLTIFDDLAKLELDYDTTIFNVAADLNLKFDEMPIFNIKINCLKEFNTDKYIKIMAYSKEVVEVAKAKVVGVIRVCKNSPQNLKKIKVVFFAAETNIHDSNTSSELGSFSKDEKDILQQVLHQSYISAEIIDKDSNNEPIILDLKDDKRFKINGDYFTTEGKIKFDPDRSTDAYDEKQDYLKEIIESQFGFKYKDYFKIIAFDHQTDLDTPNFYFEGNAQTFGKHMACLYSGKTGKRDNYTLAHEICHGLGLYHTFKNGTDIYPDQKYIFPRYDGILHINDATDNLMSYSPKTQTLWRWQWKLMHKHLKNYQYEN